MLFDGKCSVSLPHGAMGKSAVCYCGFSWSYLLFHVIFLKFNFKNQHFEHCQQGSVVRQQNK